MSNDDVDLSMIAVLGLQRSRNLTRPIIMTIGTSQMLLMLSLPTRDPEVPATQGMEGLLHSWVEENRLSKSLPVENITQCSNILLLDLQHPYISRTLPQTIAK